METKELDEDDLKCPHCGEMCEPELVKYIWDDRTHYIDHRQHVATYCFAVFACPECRKILSITTVEPDTLNSASERIVKSMNS